MTQLSVRGLGLALGVTWGLGVLMLGVLAAVGWGRPVVDVLGSVYLGYRPTPLGTVIGGAWAFVDGAAAGAIVAWLYNRLG